MSRMKTSMKIAIASIPIAIAIGCGSSKEEGMAAAKKEAEADLQKRLANKEAAKKMTPPVTGSQTVACTTLISDPAAYTTALGEKEPLTVKEITSTDADAVAVCSLIRGGKKLTAKEQEALIKKKGSGGRLGVLPGDELCRITAYCWTIEDEEKFVDRCKQRGLQPDSTLGGAACLLIVPQGADDVYSYSFLDPDTKCVIKVGGGPSLVDNNIITSCAKTARDMIGPPNIKPGATPPPTPPPAEGSGAGSAAGSAAAPQ
jgi:hypothetical protein